MDDALRQLIAIALTLVFAGTFLAVSLCLIDVAIRSWQHFRIIRTYKRQAMQRPRQTVVRHAGTASPKHIRYTQETAAKTWRKKSA